MTKPKDLGGWEPRPTRIRLDHSQRRELADLAGLGTEADGARAEALASEVEAILSQCVSNRDANFKGPSPAAQREGLRLVMLAIRNLEGAIRDLDAWTFWGLVQDLDARVCDLRDARHADIPVLPATPQHVLFPALVELARASDAQREALHGRESRGARPEVDRDRAVVELVEALWRIVGHAKEDSRGVAQDFTRRALGIAGLDAPDSEEKFWAIASGRPGP